MWWFLLYNLGSSISWLPIVELWSHAFPYNFLLLQSAAQLQRTFFGWSADHKLISNSFGRQVETQLHLGRQQLGVRWDPIPLNVLPPTTISPPPSFFNSCHPGAFSLLGNLVFFFWTGIKNFWMGLMKILDKDFESLGQGILKLMGRSIENGQGFWSFWQGRCKFKWLCMLRKRCSSNRAVHSLTWSISLPLSAIMSSQKGKFMGDLLYSSFLIK